jgi:hypothetical protein
MFEKGKDLSFQKVLKMNCGKTRKYLRIFPQGEGTLVTG